MNKIIGIAVGIALLALPAVSFADSNVTATAGTGATVSPSGVVFVLDGATQTFLAGANTGYTLSNVAIDGISQGAIGSVDIIGDAFDHTVDVTATPNAPTGGSMPWCSSQLAPGWHVDQVGGGCGSKSTYVPYNGTSCLFNQGCMIKQ
jgi:hypothetical protein